MQQALLDYTLSLSDNALILGQRNAAWCGHGPILEQDIAITNITLDLIGQSRILYQYAAQLKGGDATEDSLAFLRSEREYKNCLLVERPNGDWAQTILRQFLFSCFQRELYTQLTQGKDSTLAAIATKSLKEVSYHCRWSREWVLRLGDGTAESHTRLVKALENLWPYTGELFKGADYELALGLDPAMLYTNWLSAVQSTLEEATVSLASLTSCFMQTGGKTGIHTEELGFILTDLQYMQRTYPSCDW
ncbi:MAG: phenylacetate-CoA oxygenase subunit PaaC [Bacteroidetes bacterium]|nr:phenylacetate-CoA oxygenase subunit PaaC [Bacteroidota bacterium]